MIVQLRDYETNRPIGTVHARREHRWPAICDLISAHKNCDPDDDIHDIETDDGEEIHLNGKPVARVQYLVGWDCLGVMA